MATCTFKAGTASTAGANVYGTASFTPAANDLLIVCVVASGSTETNPSVTDSLGATTFSLVTRLLIHNSADTMFVFVSDSFVAASARTVSFHCPHALATGACVSVVSVSGMSRWGAAAIRQTATQVNNISSTTPAPAFGSACLTGNPTISFVGNSSDPGGVTAATGWTRSSSPTADLGYVTPITGSDVITRDSGFTGTTITWGSVSATGWGAISVELDTSAAPTLSEDDDENCWSDLPGIVSRGVSALALAATMLASTLGLNVAESHQDDPIQSAPTVLVEEDYWILEELPPPVPASQYLPYLPDPEEIPAGSLAKFTSPDEDYWQNEAPATPASQFQVLPYSFDAGEIVPQPAVLGPDEDLWSNPASPIAASIFQSLPYSFDAAEIVQQPSVLGPDEDFWQNPVLPSQAVFFRSPVVADPDEVPAGTLFGQYDEDFWKNPVAPVVATNLWPQPFTFDLQDPAGSLAGQPDEDYWVNGVKPLPGDFYRSTVLGDAEEVPAGSLRRFASPDEDYWQNPARPIQGALYQPLPVAFDSGEFHLTALPVFDEDFWANPVSPVAATLYQRLPLAVDPDYAPSLRTDEVYWPQALLPQPVAASLYQRLPLVVDPDFIGPTVLVFEEDAWPQAKLPAPQPSSLYQQLPIGETETIEAFQFSGAPDEDYWQNPAFPTVASLYRSTIFADLEELPAGSLISANPDEDYWQNWAAPVVDQLYRSPVFLDTDKPQPPLDSFKLPWSAIGRENRLYKGNGVAGNLAKGEGSLENRLYRGSGVEEKLTKGEAEPGANLKGRSKS